MSHQALFSLPILFTFKRWQVHQWKMRKNGELVELPHYGTIPAFDAWILRKEFVETENTPIAVLDFLNRNCWYGGPFHTFKGFCRWQEFIRRALLTPRDDWPKLETEFGTAKTDYLLGGFTVTAKWNDFSPIGSIQVFSPMGAIAITLVIDKLKGIRFDVCARPDCGKIYKIRTKHRRKYCTQACAHLENMRHLRRQISRKGKVRPAIEEKNK